MASKHDLAWAAGLVVGEGCWSIKLVRGGLNNGREYQYLQFQLGMYDERAVRRLAAMFNVNVTTSPSGEGFTRYQISVAGQRAEHIADVLGPLLEGTDKGDQLRKVRAAPKGRVN